jgi:hypothetical protein
VDGVAISHLQRQLESLYEVPLGYDVADFLITDQALARRLDTSDNARETPEKLLVSQDDESLDIALYLDQQVVDRLHTHDPLIRLHDDNLESFLLALEGVSHFVYLTWNASRRKEVTLLELELQAEIDKFVFSALLLRAQRETRLSPRLHARLFDGTAFDEALSDEERERYQDANHYAGRYCRQLERRFGSDYAGRAPLAELRHFYRLPQGDKLRRIERSAI